MKGNVASVFGLEGATAVVTGGSDGIGFAIASLFGAAKARVAIGSRRPTALQTRVDELASDGVDCTGFPLDVCDEESVRTFVSKVNDHFGRIDVLVNCAGGSFGDRFKRGALVELSADDFLEAYRLNVVGAHLCAQAVLRATPDWSGAIVNVGSVAGVRAARGMAAYGAAKAGLLNLTQSMAREWGPRIRANALVIGHVDTPRVSAQRTGPRLEGILNALPLGRLGDPQEIALAALFLSSPAAAWTTGSLVTIDGGQSAGS